MFRGITKAARISRSWLGAKPRFSQARSLTCFEGLGDPSKDVFKFNLGSFDCTLFREDVLTVPISFWFLGLSEEDKIQALQRWKDQITTAEDGTVMFSVPCTFMYIKTPTNNILIDAGTTQYLELFGDGTTLSNADYGKELLAKEVNAEDIDTILLTHAHVDHVGMLRDGDKPYFPNAKVVLGEQELATWRSANPQTGYCMYDPSCGLNYDDVKDTLKSVLIDPQVHALGAIADENIKTVTDKEEIVPGISATEVGGHTNGLSFIEVESGGERMVCTGDTAYHPLFLSRPELGVIWHAHPWQVIANVKKLAEDVSSTNSLIYSTHFPHPAPSHIQKGQDGYYETTSIG